MKPNSRLIEVSVDDLRIVTSAILSRWTRNYTTAGGREVVECAFCGMEQTVDWKECDETILNPEHKLNCAVLVAKSIEPME